MQMVDFVLQGAGEQLIAIYLEGVAFHILRLHGDVGSPADIFAEAGDGQTTLFPDLLPLPLDDLWIDEDQFRRRVFA